jgi:predicted AlkP superfamily phosphohydrolase/phosphomutase
MKRTKVIVIGIDGGERRVFNEMIRRNCMPNLQQILETSYVNQLDGYIEGPGQGWASFMTGRVPSHHGIFLWKSYHGVNSDDIFPKTLWQVLSDHGLTSGIINLSYTFPPKPLKGFMISGLGGGLSPSGDVTYSYPSDLIAELELQADGYTWGVERTRGSFSEHKRHLKELISMTHKRGKACLYLLKKKKPDFFMVVLRGADSIQHDYWHFVDSNYIVSQKYDELTTYINEYYSTLDKLIGEIWQRYENTYRFIISDHGFGPTENILRINEFLSRNGLLTKKRNFKSFVGNTLFLRVKDRLEPLYKKHLIKYRTFRNLNQKRKAVLSKLHTAIDWDKTLLYAQCPYGLSFNKKTVSTDYQRNRLYEEIRDRLLALKENNSENYVFKDVYRKENFNILNHAEFAPDLVLEKSSESLFVVPDLSLEQDVDIISNLEKTDIYSISGHHRRWGVFIADALDKRFGTRNDNLSIIDLFPTILDLFGLPIPEDLDGEVICS